MYKFELNNSVNVTDVRETRESEMKCVIADMCEWNQERCISPSMWHNSGDEQTKSTRAKEKQ
jgi:hypothetical protein